MKGKNRGVDALTQGANLQDILQQCCDYTTVLRLSYGDAKVTIDLRQMSILQKPLTKNAGLSSVRLTCSDSVRKSSYDIPKSPL